MVTVQFRASGGSGPGCPSRLQLQVVFSGTDGVTKYVVSGQTAFIYSYVQLISVLLHFLPVSVSIRFGSDICCSEFGQVVRSRRRNVVTLWYLCSAVRQYCATQAVDAFKTSKYKRASKSLIRKFTRYCYTSNLIKTKII